MFAYKYMSDIPTTETINDGKYRCGPGFGKCPEEHCCLDNGICAIKGGVNCSTNHENQLYDGIDIATIDMMNIVPIIRSNLHNKMSELSDSDSDEDEREKEKEVVESFIDMPILNLESLKDGRLNEIFYVMIILAAIYFFVVKK